MRLFSCCGFLSFLLRSGLSLFISPRLLPLLVWHEACRDERATHAWNRLSSLAMRLNQTHTCFICALLSSFFQSVFARLLIESQLAGFVSSTWPPLAAPFLGAAETQKSKIYVQVFVVSLRVCSQWGLERTKQTPAGRKTVSMVSS